MLHSLCCLTSFEFRNNIFESLEAFLGRLSIDTLSNFNPSFFGWQRTGELFHSCFHFGLLFAGPTWGINFCNLADSVGLRFGAFLCLFLRRFCWSRSSRLRLSCSLFDFIFAFFSQLLCLLDDFLLRFDSNEISDNLPALDCARWESHYAFGQKSNFFLGPVLIPFLCLFSFLSSRLLL